MVEIPWGQTFLFFCKSRQSLSSASQKTEFFYQSWKTNSNKIQIPHWRRGTKLFLNFKKYQYILSYDKYNISNFSIFNSNIFLKYYFMLFSLCLDLQKININVLSSGYKYLHGHLVFTVVCKKVYKIGLNGVKWP